MYNTSMLSKHSLCCFVLLTILLEFLSNQIPVNNKIPKQTNKQTKTTNKQNKSKKQNKKQKHKNKKTVQLICNVMDIVYQNNISDRDSIQVESEL